MNDFDQDEFSLEVTAQDREQFKRLDQFLDAKLIDYSRTFIKKLFKEKLILSTYNDKEQKVELKKMPPEGANITIFIPPQAPSELIPEDIPLEILYEDDHLVIVNKPAGMVTHPAPGHSGGTLVNAIVHHCPDLEGMHDKKRPGIVHRLDKGTSGVMVVAKNQKALEGLVKLFSTHSIQRIYEAITIGPNIPVGGTLKSTIGRHPQNRLKMAANVLKGGRDAITHYKKLSQSEKIHHLQLKLETGRTHQIRVHLSTLLRHPILCDPLYARPKAQLNTLPQELKAHLENYPHPLLHAKVLGFIHPITQKEIYVEKGPPEIFEKTLELIWK